jgi:glycosyltransferase involved in cell wall biosynthesis
MKVLALTRYERLGASSRMRFYQYLPALAAAGIAVELAPLFSDDYVRGLQQNRRSVIDVVRAYSRRMWPFRGRRQYDLLWIEKELLPWLPAQLEHAMLAGAVPYVLDYDDAVFHYYDRHRNPLVRRWLGRKHPTLMQGAALVLAGNDYLAEYARRAGARRVEIVPTVIDLERYPLPQLGAKVDGALPCVGWVGQRATASLLKPLAPLFARLTAEHAARFVAIGIDAAALGLPMDSVAWSEATEAASISALDIGIMPLVDEPFERGKCGYKLIQYMACGLPVVASPVGVNRQIVEHGVNGFLAETPAQWEEALRMLLGDAALRQRMGQAGRRLVEEKYCLQVTGPRLADSLVSLCGRQA